MSCYQNESLNIAYQVPKHVLKCYMSTVICFLYLYSIAEKCGISAFKASHSFGINPKFDWCDLVGSSF